MYQFNMDPYKFCQVLSYLRNTLAVLEYKYLPSNPNENVLILLFKRIQDIGWKSWKKKPGKSLEFCFKKSVGTLERR